MIKTRYLKSAVAADLKNKMVFIGGPRQVGKTTMALSIGKEGYKNFSYLNWDSREDRKAILEGRFRGDTTLVIFDEIHKYRQWKTYLKGEFDKYKDKFHILVTGSARLDLYRKGGDSLMGRYHYYRLHPFSLTEGLGIESSIKAGEELVFPEVAPARLKKVFEQLFAFGGFPEPFLAQDNKTLRRFHNERADRLVRGDIRDLEQVRDLSALQILVEILPEKVGSLLSLNALREDLNVAHKTISSWVDILERFYYHFRVYPFAFKTIKSLRREPKMYLWDWSQITDSAVRLENLTGSHLLKTVHFLFDALGYKAELFFLRDIDGREVDFLITIDKKPWFAVEVKLTDEQISPALKYFQQKLKIPYVYQVIGASGLDYWQNSIRLISADKFLTALV